MTFDEATGLPPGVQVIRIGQAKPDEYTWKDGAAHKGPDSRINLVVKLSTGWDWRYDMESDALRPMRVFDPPKQVVWTITIENSFQLDDIVGLRKRLVDKGGLKIDEVQTAQDSDGQGHEVGADDRSA